MSSADRPDVSDAASAEVAAVIVRAAALGFSPMRVATALGVSPSELAAIELAARPGGARYAHDPAAPSRDHR